MGISKGQAIPIQQGVTSLEEAKELYTPTLDLSRILSVGLTYLITVGL